MAGLSQFQEVLKQKDEEQLRKYLEHKDCFELIGWIIPPIKKGTCPEHLGLILRCISQSTIGQTNRRKITEAVLNEIKKSELANSEFKKLIETIIKNVTRYSKSDLTGLIEHSVKTIENNDDKYYCWKELIPEFIHSLEDEKYVSLAGNEFTGQEFKLKVVDKILGINWNTKILVPITQMLGEIRLQSPPMHKKVILRICEKLLELDCMELPPLVHQLLKLCNSLEAWIVIGTLQNYFSKLYHEANTDSIDDFGSEKIGRVHIQEVQEAEATVLFHLRESAILNNSILKDYMKYLKSIVNAPEYILNQFTMSVLLNIHSIYGDQPFEIIKQALQRKFKDDEKLNENNWLAGILPPSINVLKMMENFTANSKTRHRIMEGLVILTFVLLETKTKENEENLMHSVGIELVKQICKHKTDAVRIILEKLNDKIIKSSASISQYTECLSHLCQRISCMCFDHRPIVSKLLQELLSMRGDFAKQILLATLPLMKYSSNLQDTLIIILRKGLYRKGIESRQMAVTGFLLLLKNQKVTSMSLSQSSSSSHTTSSSAGSIFTQAIVEKAHHPTPRTNPKSNEKFCHEVLLILTKCFSHEVEVRQQFYEDLGHVVESNSDLGEIILEMLLDHFKKYYETDEDVKPPIKFPECCDISGAQAVLEEPMGHFVFALQKIYCILADKHTTFSSIKNTCTILEKLCTRMIETELEHLSLEEYVDLLDNVPVAQQKVICLKLMLTVIESLITFKINSWSSDDPDVSRMVNNLFKAYHRLSEFALKANKPKKPEGKRKKKDKNDTTVIKKNRLKLIKIPPTIIDIATLHKLLSLLFTSNVSWAKKDQTKVLKDSIEFNRYVLNSCIQQINQAKLLPVHERKSHIKRYLAAYVGIGEILGKRFCHILNHMIEFDAETALTGIQCLKELCELMCKFSNEFPQFLAPITEINKADHAEQLKEFLKRLNAIVDDFSSDKFELDSPAFKIEPVCYEIVHLVIKVASVKTSIETDWLLEWFVKLTKSDNKNPETIATVLNLITMIEERDSKFCSNREDMCIDLVNKFGFVANDEEDDNESDVYFILNETSLPNAYSIFNNSVKNEINIIAWAVARLKADYNIVVAPIKTDNMNHDNLKKKENKVFRFFAYTANTLVKLTEIKVQSNINIELTLNNLQLFYNVLNSLIKYYHNKNNVSESNFPTKFIQLVDIAGKGLKTAFYDLERCFEANQTHVTKNQVMKEIKFTPKIVFEMEQFFKEILTLQKKTKIEITHHIKQSSNRGFQIKEPELMECLERVDDVSMAVMEGQARRSQHLTGNATANAHLNAISDDSDSDVAINRSKKRRRVSSESSSD